MGGLELGTKARLWPHQGGIEAWPWHTDNMLTRTHGLHDVWRATHGCNGMGFGATFPYLELVRGRSTSWTKVVCEAMGARPWHYGTATNMTNLDGWLMHGTWAQFHGSLLQP